MFTLVTKDGKEMKFDNAYKMGEWAETNRPEWFMTEEERSRKRRNKTKDKQRTDRKLRDFLNDAKNTD